MRRLTAALTMAASAGCGDGDRVAVEQTPSDPATVFSWFATGSAAAPGGSRLRVQMVGDLTLQSAQMAVADAFVNDQPLLVPGVPPGTYPVEALVSDIDGDERVAAMRVLLSTESPASWGEVGLIAVDSGTAAVFESSLPSAVTALTVESFNDTLLKALESTYRHTWSHAALSWEGRSMVAVSSGLGDGTYPVFLGTTASRQPAAVLIDFLVLRSGPRTDPRDPTAGTTRP
jgi:hypothetical protein